MRQTLKQLREGKGIEQKILAQYAGVSVYYLSQLEQNQAKGSNLFAIVMLCDRMGLTIHQLVNAWRDFPQTDSNVCVVMTARKLADICSALECDISDIHFESGRQPKLYRPTQRDG